MSDHSKIGKRGKELAGQTEAVFQLARCLFDQLGGGGAVDVRALHMEGQFPEPSLYHCTIYSINLNLNKPSVRANRN